MAANVQPIMVSHTLSHLATLCHTLPHLAKCNSLFQQPVLTGCCICTRRRLIIHPALNLFHRPFCGHAMLSYHAMRVDQCAAKWFVAAGVGLHASQQAGCACSRLASITYGLMEWHCGWWCGTDGLMEWCCGWWCGWVAAACPEPFRPVWLTDTD